MEDTFNKVIQSRLDDYIKEKCHGAVDTFARSYALTVYGSETKLTSIKGMRKEDHIFTEEEVRNLSKVMKSPELIKDYLADKLQRTTYEYHKFCRENYLQAEPLESILKSNVIHPDDVQIQIEHFIDMPSISPMLVFCDDHEYIEYIISIGGIEAVRLEDNLVLGKGFCYGNSIDAIKEQTEDVLVGTIEMNDTSSDQIVWKAYQANKEIIGSGISKHIIIVVECKSVQKQKLLFKTFCNEPYIISCKKDDDSRAKIEDIKKHPEKGIGWGYGTLPDMHNAKYITDLSQARPGDYLCWHEKHGTTINYGKAVARKVKGVLDDSYRSFAYLWPIENEELKKVGNGKNENDCLNFPDDMNLRKVIDYGGIKAEYSWFATEFQRAESNTKELANYGNSPAKIIPIYNKDINYNKLFGMWYLPSLVELVAAREDLEEGCYWSSSISEGHNLMYDTKSNKVIEVSDPRLKALVLPFILVKRKI